MISKVEGFILKSNSYGDTSLILNVITKEYGLISIMAKGCKSAKSRLRGLVLPYTYGYFYIYYKEGKISLLKDVDVINSFTNIHEDFDRLSYTSLISDVTYQACKDNTYINKLYEIFISTINKINDKLNSKVLYLIYLIKLLDIEGIAIDFNSCSRCGSTSDILTISIDDGLICKNCYTNEALVDIRTIKYLRMFYYVDISKITNIDIDNKIIEEISNYLYSYYDKYTGIYLKKVKDINNI